MCDLRMSNNRYITSISLLAHGQKDHLHRHAVNFMFLSFISVYWSTYIPSLRKEYIRGKCTDLLLEPRRHVFTATILANAVTSFLLPDRKMRIMIEKGMIFGLVCGGSEWMFVVMFEQCVHSTHEDSPQQPLW